MTRRLNKRACVRAALAAGLALTLGAAAIAQQATPEPESKPESKPVPPTDPAEQPAPKPNAEPAPETPNTEAPKTETPQPEVPAPKPSEPAELPSLDELLGLPDADAPAGDGGADASDLPLLDPEDPAAADLDRRLSGEELPEEIQAAVALMGDTADRLELSMDLGLTTQRMQEDIVRRLDQIIEAAGEQQQQQSSSSSSSSGSQNQPNQQPPRPQQGEEGEQNQQGQGEGESTPPGRQDGELSPELRASRAAWGALPERTRDALLQGSGERFSSLYQRLTEAYYRRLAEEAER